MRCVCLIALLALSNPARADDVEAQKTLLAEQLDAWDLVESKKTLDALSAARPSDPDVLWFKGQLAFLRGRYAEAVGHYEAALVARPGDKHVAATLELAKSTLGVVKDFKEQQTSGGHFTLAWQPGVDEVLVPYADVALEKAYEALGEIFRLRPGEPIRVEIYPKVSNLADVSPLKLSEIQTSGTIALCKYNRLMIVSPRALVYGYPWLDTLAHEYTHLLVTRRSKNTVPIWLHEGMAKFFENRWRETTNAVLAPSSEDLLAGAVKKKKLIRFEAMSPSMAKLPSQEDTALAFAEVFMVMEMVYSKSGVDGVNALLDLMGSGLSDREAVEKVSEKSFDRFQKEWRQYLYQRNLQTLPTHATSRLLFREKDKPKDELKDIVEEQARQLTYLGDLLAVRQRFKAASKEYERAIERAGGPNPIISAKLASSLLKQGRHQQVLTVVTPALKLNPQHILLYLYRGKARLAIGEYEAAQRDLADAIGLNPFDPEVHGLMAEALGKLGRTQAAEQERRHQRLVTAE